MIYITIYKKTMEKKLTSVHVVNGIYKKFKMKSIDSGLSLQKLVNRALDLYTIDENFKNKIDNHKDIDEK